MRQFEQSLIFTFHHVSIKTHQKQMKIIKQFNLHSTMYLLKQDLHYWIFTRSTNLHSTMYLLKLWYVKSLMSTRKFTFHHVSIKTVTTVDVLLLHYNLHSTMYLLKLKTIIAVIGAYVFTFHHVSIKTR